jgi:hypothetical protein
LDCLSAEVKAMIATRECEEVWAVAGGIER